ncbi:MAG: GNAT family N-acetyltransferase [Deltaproteobacteria bacterium]|nr:GNAT family N-acetyltransferase [Deltaproteobacteria bacterium]
MGARPRAKRQGARHASAQGPTLRLRLATLDDARFLHRLRNDPVTRASSFHTEPIPYREHVAWLAKRLADPEKRVRLYVAMDGNGALLGQVRFDKDPKDPTRAEISIAVLPRFRDKGLGSRLLCLAVRRCPFDRILARIRIGNERSVRAFSGAGFARSGGIRKTPSPHLVLLCRRKTR